ncbi:UNVERIFIED_CONTAM: hypothetical protein K2H54_054313 [Gekko kuhli]
MCSRCNRGSHAEVVCTYAITCSLCGATGHRYRHCPYSVLNANISAEQLSQDNVATQHREEDDRQQCAVEQAYIAEARWTPEAPGVMAQSQQDVVPETVTQDHPADNCVAGTKYPTIGDTPGPVVVE